MQGCAGLCYAQAGRLQPRLTKTVVWSLHKSGPSDQYKHGQSVGDCVIASQKPHDTGSMQEEWCCIVRSAQALHQVVLATGGDGGNQQAPVHDVVVMEEVQPACDGQGDVLALVVPVEIVSAIVQLPRKGIAQITALHSRTTGSQVHGRRSSVPVYGKITNPSAAPRSCAFERELSGFCEADSAIYHSNYLHSIMTLAKPSPYSLLMTKSKAQSNLAPELH